MCIKDEDLIVIAAQQYYIEYGSALNTERLASLIPSYIPDYMIGGKGSRRDPYSWAREVERAFRKAYFSKQQVDPQQVIDAHSILISNFIQFVYRV